jgi:hypothetical protein
VGLQLYILEEDSPVGLETGVLALQAKIINPKAHYYLKAKKKEGD